MACQLVGDGQHGLIDDFDDLDLIGEPVDGRAGTWYVYTDESQGCAELSVESEEGGGSLRVTGEGFSNWGAGVGLGMAWNQQQQEVCTYDASAYGGVRFRVKGNAEVRLVVTNQDSIFQSLDGNCPDAEGCYDRYGRTITPSSDWQEVEVDFCSLTQEGWGTQLPAFNPATITAVNFNVRSLEPFDVWIDDLTFLPKTAEGLAECPAVCPEDQLPLDVDYDARTTPYQGGAPGLEIHTFEQSTPDCGPLVRRYLDYVPSALGPKSSAPVVMLLPGTSSDAESFHDFMTKENFVELADRDEFIVVYANAAPGPSTRSDWPNGGRFWLPYEFEKQVDDLAYLELVVDDLVAREVIDGSNPLFLVGHSNGGGLALEAAMAAPSLYRGIAALMPYNGNPPRLPATDVAIELDRFFFGFSHDDPDLPEGYDDFAEPMIQAWSEALGLSTEELENPTVEALADQVVEGKDYTGNNAVALRTRDSRAVRKTYGSGRQVRVLEFDHAGHFLPVRDPYEDEALISAYGFRNQDVDTSQQVWDFFKSSL